MSLVNPNDLASRDEVERRETLAQNSGSFFDANRAELIQKVEAEIDNGTDLGKSFNRHANDLGELGVANNNHALAEAVVDSWRQSATQERDWGAYRDAQAILSGDTTYADMNIDTALKTRGTQLYEASQQEQPAAATPSATAPIAVAASNALWGDEPLAAPNPSPLQAAAGAPDRPGADNAVSSSYTIRQGDTLYEIAETNLRQNGVAVSPATVQEEVQRLAELNKIKDPDKIYAGSEIQLNGEKQSDTPAPQVATKPVETTPPPPAAEQQEQAEAEKEEKRKQKIDAAWDKAEGVAGLFGFGGMLGAVRMLSDAMNEPKENIVKGEQQGMQIADGTPVTPLATPGGKQRTQERGAAAI